MAINEPTAFDPSRQLSKIKGADYLEVKWRLVWLRDQYPDAAIDTELMSHTGNQAIFRATIYLSTGAKATGWGSEDINGFANYIEKAETKAVGRALAALGFGTQFCTDFEYGADDGHVVDAPVQRGGATPMHRPGANGDGMSQKQSGMITALARGMKLSAQQVAEITQQFGGAAFDDLTRRGASAVIDELQRMQGERRG